MRLNLISLGNECCAGCGCATFERKPKGKHIGLYCSECGRWKKWMPKGDPGDFEIFLGKYRGRKLKDVPRDELESYRDWIEDAEKASRGGLLKIRDRINQFLGDSK